MHETEYTRDVAVPHLRGDLSAGVTVKADERDSMAGSTSYHYLVKSGDVSQQIHFQHGAIGEHGLNGLTNEVLISILIDRLQGFQSGQFSCRENALALTKLEEAQHWLNHRTAGRVARGVEGTNKI